MTKAATLLLSISITLILIFLAAILITWLYNRISQAKYGKINSLLDDLLFAYFDTANKEEQQQVIRDINSYVKGSTLKNKQLIERILQYGDLFIADHHEQLMVLYTSTEIKRFLIKRLSSERHYNKALACRQLGDLRLVSTESHIYKLHTINSNEVLYNVLLALSKLGDYERLAQILVSDSKNIHLSFRAIIEIMEQFNGSEASKEALFKQTIEESDDYFKAILIKAAVSGHYVALSANYVKYLKSDNIGLRIACIRALSDLKNAVYERDVIGMLDAQEWEVRAAAAKGLGNFGTIQSMEPLAKMTRDPEWWVRHNAASALIAIPEGRNYAEQLAVDEDRYSREAIAAVMER